MMNNEKEICLWKSCSDVIQLERKDGNNNGFVLGEAGKGKAFYVKTHLTAKDILIDENSLDLDEMDLQEIYNIAEEIYGRINATVYLRNHEEYVPTLTQSQYTTSQNLIRCAMSGDYRNAVRELNDCIKDYTQYKGNEQKEHILTDNEAVLIADMAFVIMLAVGKELSDKEEDK